MGSSSYGDMTSTLQLGRVHLLKRANYNSLLGTYWVFLIQAADEPDPTTT